MLMPNFVECNIHSSVKRKNESSSPFSIRNYENIVSVPENIDQLLLLTIIVPATILSNNEYFEEKYSVNLSSEGQCPKHGEGLGS